MTRYDWDKIDKRFNWVAKDANGMVEAYQVHPILKEFWWYSSGATEILGYAPPWESHSDWKESLEERPKPAKRYQIDTGPGLLRIIDTQTDQALSGNQIVDLLNERGEA